MRCTLKILLCKYVMGKVIREPFIMEGIKEKERVVEKICSVVILNISKKIVLSRISVKFPPFHPNHFSVFFYAEIITSRHLRTDILCYIK